MDKNINKLANPLYFPVIRTGWCINYRRVQLLMNIDLVSCKCSSSSIARRARF